MPQDLAKLIELDSFAKNGIMERFSNPRIAGVSYERIIQLGISGLASSLTLFALHSAQAQSSADLVAAALSHLTDPAKKRKMTQDACPGSAQFCWAVGRHGRAGDGSRRRMVHRDNESGSRAAGSVTVESSGF